MHELVISARFVNPDGTVHHWIDFGQPNLDDAALNWYVSELSAVHSHAKSAAGKNEDGGDLTAYLTTTIDGVDPNPNEPPITGVSLHALGLIQDRISDIGGKLRQIRDQRHAHGKAKKHP